MWLSFGWSPPILGGISIFFNSVITAFVGLPLEIALMSFYKCRAFSIGIILIIADRASCETIL